MTTVSYAAESKNELAHLSLQEAISLARRAGSGTVTLLALKVAVVVDALGASPLAAAFSSAPVKNRRVTVALADAERALAAIGA